MSARWIDPRIWEQPADADAVRLDVVFDDDFGCIASVSLPTGESATFADPHVAGAATDNGERAS